jgi:hypothetical protein
MFYSETDAADAVLSAARGMLQRWPATDSVSRATVFVDEAAIVLASIPRTEFPGLAVKLIRSGRNPAAHGQWNPPAPRLLCQRPSTPPSITGYGSSPRS